MNFGIDFSGGTLIELRANSGDADLAELRGKATALGLGDGRGAGASARRPT